MRVSERLLVAVAALGLLPCSLALSAQTLQVVGTDGKATTLSAAQITALPHVKASVQDHGATLEFEFPWRSARLRRDQARRQHARSTYDGSNAGGGCRQL